MATRTQQLYKVTLTWHDKVEVLEGWGHSRESAAADAMNHAGYGGGAIRALKVWDAEEITDGSTQAHDRRIGQEAQDE